MIRSGCLATRAESKLKGLGGGGPSGAGPLIPHYWLLREISVAVRIRMQSSDLNADVILNGGGYSGAI